MNRKFLTAMAALSTLGITISTSIAEETPTPPKDESQMVNRDIKTRNRPAGWVEEVMLSRILRDKEQSAELGISEEQLKALNTAEGEFRAAAQELRVQISEVEKAQAKLMEEGSTDEAAMVAEAEKLANLRLQVEKAHIKNLVTVRKTLSKEQLLKLKEIAMTKQQRKSNPKGEMPPPPPMK